VSRFHFLIPLSSPDPCSFFQGDLVGALLFHPEAVKFVEQLTSFSALGEMKGSGIFDGHYTQAYDFDGGNLIEASRTIESLIIEEYSKAIWFLKSFNTNSESVFKQTLSELGLADDFGNLINGINQTMSDINNYPQNSNNNGMNEFFRALGEQVTTLLYGKFASCILWKNPFDLNYIDSLRALFNKGEITNPPASPIILDLDGDGVETTSVGAGAYFDHDGNGFAQQTGWASSDDGMLVRDINSDGLINDGKELFGNETLLNNGSKAANGFQALSELDGNVDGKVDANDSAWSSLKIWQDADGDGYKRKARGYRQGAIGNGKKVFSYSLVPLASRLVLACFFP